MQRPAFDLRKPPSAFEAAFSAPEDDSLLDDSETDDTEDVGFGQDIDTPRPTTEPPRRRMLEATRADQQGGTPAGTSPQNPPQRPTQVGQPNAARDAGLLRNRTSVPNGKAAAQGLKAGVHHAEEKAAQNVAKQAGGKLLTKLVGGSAGGPIGTAIAVLSSAKDVWQSFRSSKLGQYIIMGVLAVTLSGMLLMIILGFSLIGTLSNFGAAIRGGLRLAGLNVESSPSDKFNAAVAAQERGIVLDASLESMDAARVKIAQILDRNTLKLSADQLAQARQILTEMHNTRLQMKLPNSAPSATDQAKLRQEYRNQFNKLYATIFPGVSAAQGRIKALILSGTLKFDTSAGRRDLELTNTPVDPKLLELVAGLGEFAADKGIVIRITAVKSDHNKYVRDRNGNPTGKISEHYYGKSIDIAEATPGKKILNASFTEPLMKHLYDNREAYGINDMFWDGSINGQKAPYSIDNGRPVPGKAIGGHLNHIHISVK